MSTQPTQSEDAAASAGPAALLRGRDGWAVWLATAGGAGFAPWAPGTAGSLVALAGFAWLQPAQLLPYLLFVALVSGLGVFVSGRAGAATGIVDDGRIVIDEVAGQLMALAPLVAIGPEKMAGAHFWALLVTAFVAFRVFDIAKPGPVRWAERHYAGGLGVMADDWVAGGLAALVVAGVGAGMGMDFASGSAA